MGRVPRALARARGEHTRAEEDRVRRAARDGGRKATSACLHARKVPHVRAAADDAFQPGSRSMGYTVMKLTPK